MRYLHSEVDTLRRVELLRQLRLGEYDVLVGINLLREGLDLPEVSLVAILDADKEGFLRVPAQPDPDHRPRGPQRVRRGAHVRRQDHRLDETGHRRDRSPPRAKQIAYNEEKGIDPQPLRKKIADILDQVYREADDTDSRGRRLGAQRRRAAVGPRESRAGPSAPGSSRAATRRACRGPSWPT